MIKEKRTMKAKLYQKLDLFLGKLGLSILADDSSEYNIRVIAGKSHGILRSPQLVMMILIEDKVDIYAQNELETSRLAHQLAEWLEGLLATGIVINVTLSADPVRSHFATPCW